MQASSKPLESESVGAAMCLGHELIGAKHRAHVYVSLHQNPETLLARRTPQWRA